MPKFILLLSLMMKGHIFRNIFEKDKNKISFYTLTYSRKLV